MYDLIIDYLFPDTPLTRPISHPPTLPPPPTGPPVLFGET